MNDKIFLDTNIWVYFFEEATTQRQVQSQNLVSNNYANIMMSTQVLGELFTVLKRQGNSTNKIIGIIERCNRDFEVVGIMPSNTLKALEIHQKYQFSFYDSLIVATALLNNCKILYSEDMHNGQLIDNQLLITNPFI
jgi:predicted nucleic acid-binding protein